MWQYRQVEFDKAPRQSGHLAEEGGQEKPIQWSTRDSSQDLRIEVIDRLALAVVS